MLLLPAASLLLPSAKVEAAALKMRFLTEGSQSTHSIAWCRPTH